MKHRQHSFGSVAVRKSTILRKFRFYLLFSLCISSTSVLIAQDRESRFGGRGDFGGFRDGNGFGRGGDRGMPDSDSGGFGGRRDRGPPGGFGGGFGGEGGGREFRGPPGGFGGGGFGGGGGDFPGGGFPRRDRGDRGDFDNSPSSESPSSSSSTTTRKPVMKSKERITIALPASYVVADLDQDGQIAFYEWRQWKRGDLAGFLALDSNNDGFLTPLELTKGPSSGNASTSVAVAGGSPPVTTTTTSSSASSAPVQAGMVSVTTPAASTVGSSQAETVGEGRFRLLDSNKDGILSAEEWARSSKIKAQFTEAGIDLTAPMPKAQFVQHFAKLNP